MKYDDLYLSVLLLFVIKLDNSFSLQFLLILSIQAGNKFITQQMRWKDNFFQHSHTQGS